jgi:hypothetical protein
VTTAQVVEVTPDRLDKAVRRGNVDRASPSTRIFFLSFSSSFNDSTAAVVSASEEVIDGGARGGATFGYLT